MRHDLRKGVHGPGLQLERLRGCLKAAAPDRLRVDSELRFTYESPHFFEIFPVSPERIIGKTRHS